MKTLALAVSFLLLTGCATLGIGPKPLEVTGESLAAIGQSYAVAAKIISADCNAGKTYTKKQCADFRAFGEKFKIAYPAAKDLWIAASQFEDKALAENAAAALAKLLADLAPFLALAGVK